MMEKKLVFMIIIVALLIIPISESFGAEKKSCIELVKEAIKQIKGKDVKIKEGKVKGKPAVEIGDDLIIVCKKMGGKYGKTQINESQNGKITINPDKNDNLAAMKITMKHELTHLEMMKDGKNNGYYDPSKTKPVHNSHIWENLFHDCHEVIVRAESLKYIQEMQKTEPEKIGDLKTNEAFLDSIEGMKNRLADCMKKLEKYKDEPKLKKWHDAMKNVKEKIISLKIIIQEKAAIETTLDNKTTKSEKRLLKNMKNLLAINDQDFSNILVDVGLKPDDFELDSIKCINPPERQNLRITASGNEQINDLLIQNIGTTSISEIFIENDNGDLNVVTSEEWTGEKLDNNSVILYPNNPLEPNDYGEVTVLVENSPSTHLIWHTETSEECVSQDFVIDASDEFDTISHDDEEFEVDSEDSLQNSFTTFVLGQIIGSIVTGFIVAFVVLRFRK